MRTRANLTITITIFLFTTYNYGKLRAVKNSGSRAQARSIASAWRYPSPVRRDRPSQAITIFLYVHEAETLSP